MWEKIKKVDKLRREQEMWGWRVLLGRELSVEEKERVELLLVLIVLSIRILDAL